LSLLGILAQSDTERRTGKSWSLLSGFVLEKNDKFVKKKKNQDVPYSRYLTADSILHIWDIVFGVFL